MNNWQGQEIADGVCGVGMDMKVDKNATVTLQEVTKETVREIVALEVAEDQTQFVAPNAVSIAEAYFEEKAWFRAIYADGTPVGFMMTFEEPERPFYYLWRLMIAEPYQGLGFGREAMKLLIERIKQNPEAQELKVSAVPGEGSPIAFYEGLGFVDTGEVHDGEHVYKLIISNE